MFLKADRVSVDGPRSVTLLLISWRRMELYEVCQLDLVCQVLCCCSYDHPKDRGFLTCPLDILDGKDDRKHDLEGKIKLI